VWFYNFVYIPQNLPMPQIFLTLQRFMHTVCIIGLKSFFFQKKIIVQTATCLHNNKRISCSCWLVPQVRRGRKTRDYKASDLNSNIATTDAYHNGYQSHTFPDRLIEQQCVQYCPLTTRFKLLQQLIDIVVQVVRLRHLQQISHY